MKKEAYKIHIIGAGVSGLIAAQVLENNGYSPIIIEATDRVGGRVKTDRFENYQLDHGFQVLLTAYPAAQKYLNFEALNLQHFISGAAIYKNGSQKIMGDPLRNISLLFPTLFSGIGNISDKFKILKLNTKLKKTTLEAIFTKPEKTTLQYLKDLGFSDDIILSFFKPFFAGIFLEPALETSSRMFEFVYKMFGEGFAALPKAGIEAIPKQLKANLKQTTFQFNTNVKSVAENQIILDDGTALESHSTIIATDPSRLIPNLIKKETEWKSCETLYFEAPSRAIQKPFIGLISNEDALINNIFYHTSLETESSGNQELLSVTVVKNHGLDTETLKNQVESELQKYCGANSYKFLKQYSISKALPKLNNLKYQLKPSETQASRHIFLAGDLQLNSSLNAAMLSGESAALGVIEALSNADLK
ncbi:FAD-dependent oxidoreductase [Bizionia myxarmorum]|uniref:FAD-dependent oxidoreductase n=1 Tax=Bizionia myxarmorum TaxID=291186 RepID=A0A5D0RG27_9FLAO|nr:FAD-dependent oxidoreductase [Bizionia myxarmorum]TYB79775.1 FAD-dependent oxidoreductase [Bizionia myxarmorum]